MANHPPDGEQPIHHLKRPLAIYFVASWCFFAMMMQAAAMSSLLFHLADGQMSIEFRKQLLGIAIVLVSVHVVLLVQLGCFSRWLSIGFFCFQTLFMAWNGLVHLSRGDFSRVALVLAFCVLDVASAWYLGRRSLREFAVQFVDQREREKHSRMMQKIAQENIRRGL